MSNKPEISELRKSYKVINGEIYKRMGSKLKSGLGVVRCNGKNIPRSHMVWALEKGEWPTSRLFHKDGNNDNDNLSNLEPMKTKARTATAPANVAEAQPIQEHQSPHASQSGNFTNQGVSSVHVGQTENAPIS